MVGMPRASPRIAQTDRSDERPESTPFGSQAPCPAESAGRRSLRVRGRRNRRSLTESERMAEDAAVGGERDALDSGMVGPRKGTEVTESDGLSEPIWEDAEETV